MISYYTYNNDDYAEFYLDKSSSFGILHITRELSVVFKKVNNVFKFYSAWFIGVSEMAWNEDEESDFELSFPGLLNKIRKELK